jgi:hypothetical protein
MKLTASQLRRIIRETVDQAKKGRLDVRDRRSSKILKEDASRVANAAASQVNRPGDLGEKLYRMLTSFDDDDLRDFVDLPNREGIKMMVQMGVDPSEAFDAWLKTWQAASAIAYPDEFTDTW